MPKIRKIDPLDLPIESTEGLGLRETQVKVYLTLEEKEELARLAPRLQHANKISRSTVSTLIYAIVHAALRGENFLADCSVYGTNDVNREQGVTS